MEREGDTEVANQEEIRGEGKRKLDNERRKKMIFSFWVLQIMNACVYFVSL